MQRHIVDKTRTRDSASRVVAFLKAERDASQHPAITALHRQSSPEPSGRLVKEFLRIDRGETV